MRMINSAQTNKIAAPPRAKIVLREGRNIKRATEQRFRSMSDPKSAHRRLDTLGNRGPEQIFAASRMRRHEVSMLERAVIEITMTRL
jgi:hypothetical protein